RGKVQLFHLADERDAVGRGRYREDCLSPGGFGAQDHIGEVSRPYCVFLGQHNLIAVLGRAGCPQTLQFPPPVGAFGKDGHPPRALLRRNARVEELVDSNSDVWRFDERRKEIFETLLVDGMKGEGHPTIWNLVLFRYRRRGGMQVAAEPAEEGDDALAGERLEAADGLCWIRLVIQNGQL